MLVFFRKPGESIVIDENIVITVLECGEKGWARLGIEAPRTVKVDRQEIHDARERGDGRSS